VPEETLWRNYKREHSEANREALILNYLWFVKYICGRMAMTLPSHIRADDLVSSGVFGLIDAIEKFDDRRKNQFRTYAFSRIKGAVLDELRRLDWAPRVVRRKARELEKVSAQLKHTLNRMPTADEISESSGYSKDEVERVYRDVAATSLLSLEEVLWESDNQKGVSRLDTIVDLGQESPKDALLKSENKSLLAAQISQLEEKERLVLTLYYFDEGAPEGAEHPGEPVGHEPREAADHARAEPLASVPPPARGESDPNQQ
jgi:RNA polymerase sigma factor for flagellar operon FliA